MKRIAIIGGGWLGAPLAHYLETIGHKVFVSRTSQVGVQKLKSDHLDAFKLDLALEDESDLAIKLSALSPNILIGCFPPGFRKGKGTEYADYWYKLTQAAKQAQVERVVMVSSTTVYPSSSDEMVESAADLQKALHSEQFSENAKIMLTAEQGLIESGLSYGIVRCSGLVGPDRHPSRFVSMLKQISTLAPANMLHLTDAIGAISFVAFLDKSVTVNATTPNTTNKAEFYQAALKSVCSDIPFPPTIQQPDKRILSDKLIGFGYKFHFQHTLEII